MSLVGQNEGVESGGEVTGGMMRENKGVMVHGGWEPGCEAWEGRDSEHGEAREP